MASNKTRITAGMTLTEVIITMADGNPGALTCMMQMVQSDPMAMLDLLSLDSLGIYGSKLYMLWSDCCGRDMKKFKETIIAFREGKFSYEEIHANLNQTYGKPFI